MPVGRPSIIFCRLGPNSVFRWSSASAFESHSEASDVFARTFQGYPSSSGVSSGNRNFLRFPTTFRRFGPNLADARNNPVRNSATMANNLTPTNRRGALSSWCFLSTAVAWVWIPVCPDSRLALISGCDRDQTLGLRSVFPLGHSLLLSGPACQFVIQRAEARSCVSATPKLYPTLRRSAR